jgi:hypothetical protein
MCDFYTTNYMDHAVSFQNREPYVSPLKVCQKFQSDNNETLQPKHK